MDELSKVTNQRTTKIREFLKPDPDGDAVLKCQDQDTDTTVSFRVSSKVLRLASPVFVSMFSPRFREGQGLLQGECLVIELGDDDASMMSLILNVLHYQAGDEEHTMDAERLACLAIHCDKYDCIKALGPWISVWFKNLESMGQPGTEFGFKLLAAYLFNDLERFRKISKAALEELILNFPVEWEEEETLALLPTSISSKSRHNNSNCDAD